MDFVVHTNLTPLPTIHVVSDSVGLTAQSLARAAAAQFGVTNPCIEVLPKVRKFDEVKRFLEDHMQLHRELKGSPRILVCYTIVDKELRTRLAEFAASEPDIIAIDLMTQVIDAISDLSGLEPSSKPGGLHVADQHYFRRIEAIEFTIAHDDGQNPEDLTKADIVLLGVSRSSKTPLSIYLSQLGYKVANVPLDSQTEPPKELFAVDPTRIFGLMTTPELLVEVRKRRLAKAEHVASSYSEYEAVCEELASARDLMRKLGCIVIRTDNRAIEETAQEILRYYESAHPQY